MLSKKIQEDGSIWKWIDLEAQQAAGKAIEAAREAEKAIRDAEEAAILATEKAARKAEEAAREAEEAMMKVIYDSAEMGKTVVIIAEEEASDKVVFDEEGNMQDSETEVQITENVEQDDDVSTSDETDQVSDDKVP